MYKIIDRIINSQPSLVGEEAKQLFLSFLGSQEYVAFASDFIGLKLVSFLSEIFIDVLSYVDIPDRAQLHLSTPIHVLSFYSDISLSSVTVLVYSNGLVLCSHPSSENKDPKIVLYISQSTIDQTGVILDFLNHLDSFDPKKE